MPWNSARMVLHFTLALDNTLEQIIPFHNGVPAYRRQARQALQRRSR